MVIQGTLIELSDFDLECDSPPAIVKGITPHVSDIPKL